MAPELATIAYECAQTQLREVGLTLNREKTKIWFPDGDAGGRCPAQMADLKSRVLPCLGCPLPFVRAATEEDAEERTEPLAAATRAHIRFKQQLRVLRDHGLSVQSALILHKNYVNGAITHLLRDQFLDENFCETWDGELLEFWAQELQCPTLHEHTIRQIFLPITLGGCGLQSASLRRASAYLGSVLPGGVRTSRMSQRRTLRPPLSKTQDDARGRGAVPPRTGGTGLRMGIYSHVCSITSKNTAATYQSSATRSPS